MERVFVTYDLLPHTSQDDYVAFSREKDQVIVPHVPGIMRFDVNWILSATEGPDNKPSATPPVQVIESLEVASWDAFVKALQTDEIKALGPEFATLADVESVRMLRATQI